MAFGIVIIVVMIVIAVVTTILWFKVYNNDARIKEILSTIKIYAAAARLASDNDSKINAIIDILIRNAKTEAIVKGLATINSPLSVTDDARSAFSGMASDLKQYYKNIGSHLSENDLFLDVQKRFGDRMLKETCLPLGLMNNSCLMIAIEIAREQD